MSDISFAFQNEIYLRRQQCFDECGSLASFRFDADNGLVSQLRHARNYINNWSNLASRGLGLLFWGPPGTGKTFAAACIANHFLESPDLFTPSVVMTTFGVILRKLITLNPQDREVYFRKLMDCRLLILDDFGMERQTDYAREQVFNIINGRYLDHAPMILTTNLSLQELKNPRAMADRRIYDRILERCLPVCFDGESLRQALASENMAFYRQLLRDTGA